MKLVLTLGALLADVPHTRPVSITGLASDQALIDRLGFERTNYEGPTGHRRRAARRLRAGRPAVGEPLGGGAPLRGRRAEPEGRAGAGARFEGSPASRRRHALEEASEDYERQVNAAVESDPDVKAFVERLEETTDEAEEVAPSEEIPSGGRDRARLPAVPSAARAQRTRATKTVA